MPPLPMTVTPEGTNGWYLRKHGSAGSEALCYLPVFNDRMRSLYTRKGYVLLSQAIGDFSDKADPLHVEPPADETIREMIAELGTRVKADDERAVEQIAQLEEKMQDTEGRERGLYRQAINQLKRERASLGTHIPTFEKAKLFFVRIHRAQLRKKIDPRVVQQQEAMAEDGRWAAEQAELMRAVGVASAAE